MQGLRITFAPLPANCSPEYSAHAAAGAVLAPVIDGAEGIRYRQGDFTANCVMSSTATAQSEKQTNSTETIRWRRQYRFFLLCPAFKLSTTSSSMYCRYRVPCHTSGPAPLKPQLTVHDFARVLPTYTYRTLHYCCRQV